MIDNWNIVSYSKEDFEYWLKSNEYAADLFTEEDMTLVASRISEVIGNMDVLEEVMGNAMQERIRDKFPPTEVYAYLMNTTERTNTWATVWCFTTPEKAYEWELKSGGLRGRVLCRLSVRGFIPEIGEYQMIEGYKILEVLPHPAPLSGEGDDIDTEGGKNA